MRGGYWRARGASVGGSAILAPTAPLLKVNLPAGPQRARAVSCYAAAGGVAVSIGLVVGGMMADFQSGRAGFLINLPIGSSQIRMAGRVLSEAPARPGGMSWI